MKDYKIEEYILGELKGNELLHFEQELLRNPELLLEVENQRSILTGLKDIKLRNKIENNYKLLKRNRLIKFLSIIALSIFGVLLSWKFFISNSAVDKPKPTIQLQDSLIYKTNNNPIDSVPPNIIIKDSVLKTEYEKYKNKKKDIQKSPPIAESENKSENPILETDPISYADLASNYYSVPEEFAFTRGVNKMGILDSAKYYFNEDNFELCMRVLNSLNSDPDQVQYFKAQVLFKLRKYSEAINVLNKLLESQTIGSKREELEWYLLLNYIGCGIACEASFNSLYSQKLQNKSHSYFQQAKNILREINKLNK
ncbi:MAG: hypothetical protein HOP11_11640 [Saprospiraceae bacterium]|nr:hypothetical protein [Saprospiraceae bacterium]